MTAEPTRPRRWSAAPGRPRGRRLDAGAVALRHRRLALPDAAAGGHLPARQRRRPGRAGGRTRVRDQRDDARRRYVDRRQRDRPRHRGRHHPAPEQAASGSTPRRGPPRSSRASCTPRCRSRRAPHGLRFGPDPSTHTRCTIGGMIGNNACGSRALGYGRTADNVVGLKVALSDGEVIGPRGAGARLLGRRGAQPARLRRAPCARRWSTLTPVTRPRLIRTEFGRFARQVSGYSLEHLLPENDRRFDRFLVGSEGTLGVVLEATVRLVEDAPYRALAVLGFSSMATPPTPCRRCWPTHRRSTALAACEGLDHRITDLVAGAPPAARRARAGSSSRSPATPRREAASRGRAPSRPRPARRPGSSPTRRAGRALADPRGRRRPGRPLAVAAGALRLGGRRGSAGAARRLPARLRGAAHRRRARHRSLRPLRRRLRARPDRLRARRRRRPRPVPPLHRGRRRPGRRARRLDERRARRRPGALRAARPDVLARGDGADGGGQARPRPAQPAQPRRAGRPASRSTPRSGWRAPPAGPLADAVRRGAPLHRRRQVRRRQHRRPAG